MSGTPVTNAIRRLRFDAAMPVDDLAYAGSHGFQLSDAGGREETTHTVDGFLQCLGIGEVADGAEQAHDRVEGSGQVERPHVALAQVHIR